MCLAVPGKIISIKDNVAEVNFGNTKKNVFLGNVKAKNGDYVLVGSGIVVQKISKKDAMEINKVWKKIK
jgi:hydrogenase expression/formation protein HypC